MQFPLERIMARYRERKKNMARPRKRASVNKSHDQTTSKLYAVEPRE